MRFEWQDGLIWVSVELEYEGTRYTIDHCLVDTGSATTAFDIDFVDFNFRKPAIITRLYGIGGGTQEVIAQKVDGITIDTHKIQHIEVEFGNIRSDIGMNGFIGNDLLSVFTLIIDYSKQEIEFKQ